MEVTVLALKFPTESTAGTKLTAEGDRRDPHFSAKTKLHSSIVTPGPVPDLRSTDASSCLHPLAWSTLCLHKNRYYGNLPSVQHLGPFPTVYLFSSILHVPLNDLAPWGIPHRAFMSWSNLANAIEDYSCEFTLTWRLRTAARMSPVRMSRTSMNRPSRTTNIAFLSSSKFQSSFTEHHF
jgi:hypothetical protein